MPDPRPEWEEPINLAQIRSTLGERLPQQQISSEHKAAAVAMLLHTTPAGLELLFIERASHPQDPWSGNLAFPGGRVDPGDHSSRAAAERECREEITLDLAPAELIGQLDDITGAYLPVRISCFVYHLPERPELQLNHEVTRCFWFPLDELTASSRQVRTTLHWHGKSRQIQGIHIDDHSPLLWGITYRLTVQLLQRLGRVDPALLQVIDD